MSRLPQSRFSKTATVLSALACVLAVPAMLAQTSGSPITEDSQVAYTLSGTSFTTNSTLRGVAVSPVDRTIYVADLANKRVIRITPAANGYVSPTAGTLSGAAAAQATTGITLTGPTAVAVDASGNLFIADGGSRLIKVTAPETTHTAAAINYITTTKNPVALAVDPKTNALYIADDTNHAIYSLASGATGGATYLALYTTTTKPVGLAADSSSNVYYADAATDAVYIRTSAGSNSVYLDPTGTYAFEFSSTSVVLPISMGLDPAGNLYVLDSGVSVLDSGVSTTTAHLFEIPMLNYYYLVPFSNLSTSTTSLHATGIALDSIGNILLADDPNNKLDKLFYNNPLNFGPVDANDTTATITANFQFNTAASGIASYQNVQGDYTGEFTEVSTTCGTSESVTSICIAKYRAKYQPATPGLRAGVFGFTDNSATTNPILAVRVNAIDVAGSMALYPGTQATLSQTSTTLHEPQGLAVTGGVNAGGVNTSSTNAFNGNLFIADEGIDYNTSPLTYPYHAVYQYTITGGVISSTPTVIAPSTPATVSSFPTPLAVALDAEGDLFVGDYNGTVYVVQPSYNSGKMSWLGSAKTLTFTGVTLYHPMALTFDPEGDLFIGDMGSANVNADSSTPGYIVEVPAGPLACGTTSCTIDGLSPFKLTNATGIIFPQSLVTDTTGNLFIGDGGDGDTDLGGVFVLPAADLSSTATGTPTLLSFGSVNQPTGLSFDAANDLYVLDSYNERVLVGNISETGSVPAVNGKVVPLGTNQSSDGSSGLTSTLTTPSNMVVWPGGNNLTITDVGYQPAGSGASSPVQVLTLEAFDSASVSSTQGSSATVYGVNTGNTEITFENPNYSGPSTCGLLCQIGLENPTPDYTLSGCGSANGDKLNTGIVDLCTGTITNTTGTTDSATFTLIGNPNDDYSTLGNVINVNGTGSGGGSPVGTLSPYFAFTSSNSYTTTLTNTGTGSLVVSGISVSGVENTNGSTCKAGTSLTAGNSCTITYTFSGEAGLATITVTDNGTGTSNGQGNSGGTTQTAYTLYISFALGLDTPALDLKNIGVPSGAGDSHGGFQSNDLHSGNFGNSGQPDHLSNSNNGIKSNKTETSKDHRF